MSFGTKEPKEPKEPKDSFGHPLACPGTVQRKKKREKEGKKEQKEAKGNSHFPDASKCQATVALSTVEAEYVAMSRCTQQMVWMQTWLDEVQIEHEVPGVIMGDSRGGNRTSKEYEGSWQSQAHRHTSPLL